MTDASVGFHCPECVRAGTRGVRKAKTALGGEKRDQANLVTTVLIGINVVIWLVLTFAESGELDEQLVLLKRVIISDGELAGVLTGEWYRMLTATFAHVEIWHLALNMFALWILGSFLEPVLGRWRFLALYLISGLGGSVASLLASELDRGSLGASGAVFGLFGAALVVGRRFGVDMSLLYGILAINLVIGFTVRFIDWQAHVGGLVTGVALALVFAHAPSKHRVSYGVAACVVMLAVIVGVTAVFIA
jgi:membrane associated rhomboid family serine protease